jgi:hypothetical protein
VTTVRSGDTVASVAVPQSIRVVLEIEGNMQTISGRLSVVGGTATPFYGWLELIDKLERAAQPGRAETTGPREAPEAELPD